MMFTSDRDGLLVAQRGQGFVSVSVYFGQMTKCVQKTKVKPNFYHGYQR